MRGLSQARAQRPVTSGLGTHYSSPQKGRKQKQVRSYAHDRKRQKMEDKLDALKQQATSTSSSALAPIPVDNDSGSGSLACPSDDSDLLQNSRDVDEDWEDADEGLHCDMNKASDCDMLDASAQSPETTCGTNVLTKRLIPDETAQELYERWRALVPSLVPPLLQYMDSTMGQEWVRPPLTLKSKCAQGALCATKKHTVTALLFANFLEYTVQVCPCEPICHLLVRNGLFPTAPLLPRQAVSVELLDLFLALTEHSSDAVTAMSAALNASYRKRAFAITNVQGKKVQQPFRRGLGYALQWYDCALVEIERQKARAIASKFYELFKVPSGTGEEFLQPPTPSPSTTAPLDLQADECHRILQLRCAGCFGGRHFGSSFASGGDIHVAVDATFNHRRLRSASSSPEFYQPDFFISKEEVDAVGARIDQKRPPKVPRASTVPDIAVDSCQESHEAGTGSNVKTSMEKFDIGGLAALVCRHDIPLFIANVDTPGEQQKYAVSLIEHMFKFIPRNATVVALYDVGLYLLREIKATVQRKATSTFWEFDKLDRAAGGKDIALGTKMHQHVRSSMSKKTVALTKAIQRYNTECQALAAMRPPGCQIPVPDPLPTSMVELKRDNSLMENVWIEPVTDGSHRWVHDQDVRDGIRAMLRLQRCREERRRLGTEADNMFRWYRRELQAIMAAIDDPSNSYLMSQLRLQFEEVAELKSTWGTAFIPEASYDAHLSAIQQSAGSSPFTWIPVVVSGNLTSRSKLNVLVAEELDLECSQLEQDPSTRPSVEEVCLNDLYEEQFGLEVIVEREKHPLCTLIWQPPDDAQIQVDATILADLSRSYDPVQDATLSSRRLCNSAGGCIFIFNKDKEMKQLSDRYSRLNDECIVGISTMMQQQMGNQTQARRCAIFSSHDLNLARYDVNDSLFWRRMHPSRYFEKDVWILPIHRPTQEHWVAAVIIPYARQIFLFDSLAGERLWKRDIPIIMKFIQRLVDASRDNGWQLSVDLSIEWHAQPLFVNPVQSNSYDCGIWVIAFIVSVLRGFTLPGLNESDIATFRDALLQHVLHLPLQT
ncbi:hypothetical protein H1R20_g2518, partial [Candolleomyces eurysporus]